MLKICTVVEVTLWELSNQAPPECPFCGGEIVFEVDCTVPGFATMKNRDSEEGVYMDDDMIQDLTDYPDAIINNRVGRSMAYLYVYGYYCSECESAGEHDFDDLYRVVWL